MKRKAPDRATPSGEDLLRTESIDIEGTGHDDDHFEGHTKATAAPSSLSTSNFRNVSACNRCRLRKNRCDQHLPSCAACQKARTRCVGFDPITKQEIPRSYYFFLENRVAYLESLLEANSISFAPPEAFTDDDDIKKLGKRSNGEASAVSIETKRPVEASSESNVLTRESNANEKLDNLVSHARQVAVQGASDSRYLGSTAGISFARVVFAAVKTSLNGAPSEKGGTRPSRPLAAGTTGVTMRDSFFGLDKKPTFKPAPFPSKELGFKLVNLYFEHANPQIPILHRLEFMSMFERVYLSNKPTKRELYLLNIVFAIGAGTIVGKEVENKSRKERGSPSQDEANSPASKKRKLQDEQRPPEEYHSSAMEHLGDFLAASTTIDKPFEFNGALEELQAVLLLAGFALLRPVAPGLWYIIGVAVRLAIDLGLHQEDFIEHDEIPASTGDHHDNGQDGKHASHHISAARAWGKRQYIRDFRRRLWWCVYSFDRLVSTVVGRPFGITDIVITTNFPSLVDDQYITPAGVPRATPENVKPSPKFVAYHYFRLRLLQSEILQVLQHRQADMVRQRGINRNNPYMHTNMQSPFLKDFGNSFRAWRNDIDRRLLEWKESAPTSEDTGVQFSPLFLELNYWKAVIMLYRQSLTVPRVLAEELKSVDDNVGNPGMVDREERGDEDRVFLKVAEAGQRTLKLYRQLHRMYVVNYTFLATHHLFMAGISFLYAIWHSTVVRSRLTLDDVDFTVLAATSVLDDLIEMCPPAEPCRNAFIRMSKATIKMCLATTGFGDEAKTHLEKEARKAIKISQSDRLEFPIDPQLGRIEPRPFAIKAETSEQTQMSLGDEVRKGPLRFDLDFRGLFDQATDALGSPGATSLSPRAQQQQQTIGLAPTYPTHQNSKRAARHAQSRSLSSLVTDHQQGVKVAKLEEFGQPISLSRTQTMNASRSPLMSPGRGSQQNPLGASPFTTSNGGEPSMTPGDNPASSPFLSKVHAEFRGNSPFSDLEWLKTMPFPNNTILTASSVANTMDPGVGVVSDETGQLHGMPAGTAEWDFDLGMCMGMGWDGSLPFTDNQYMSGDFDASVPAESGALPTAQYTAVAPDMGANGAAHAAAQHGGSMQGFDLFEGFFFGGAG